MTTITHRSTDRTHRRATNQAAAAAHGFEVQACPEGMEEAFIRAMMAAKCKRHVEADADAKFDDAMDRKYAAEKAKRAKAMQKSCDKVFAYLTEPRTTAEICDQFNRSKQWVWSRLNVLRESGLVRMEKKPSGKSGIHAIYSRIEQ